MATRILFGMDPSFERVHTVNDHYDGPRSGIADFRGAPHVYRAVFSEGADDWEPGLFELRPLSDTTFALAMENWAIWQRFEARHRAGEVVWSGIADEWGALPEDLSRHRELAVALAHDLTIDSANRVLAHAEFRVVDSDEEFPSGVLRPLEVRWLPVESKTCLLYT